MNLVPIPKIYQSWFRISSVTNSFGKYWRMVMNKGKLRLTSIRSDLDQGDPVLG